MLQLQLLNGLVPVLQHVLDSGAPSPRDLYLWLSECAGRLQSFSGGDPAALPKFQHTDLRATFGELFARLLELLRSLALAQCIAIPLNARTDGLYVAKLEDERLPRCTTFVLAVRSDLSESLVAEQLPRLTKLASWNEIHRLVGSALSGIPLQVSFRPPPEIPVRPGVVYFALGAEGERWSEVLRERSLALYLPRPFDPATTQLELLAVPPER
jgi:type VI secretion system protein ImpJ